MAERFAIVDAENPRIWELFVNFTIVMIQRGFENYSARAVMHRVRWETNMELGDNSDFKINNNWTPYYARKFHSQFPQHEGFFRNRISRADKEE